MDDKTSAPPALSGAGGLTRAAGGVRHAAHSVARVMAWIAGWAFVVCALFIGGEVLARNFLGVSTQSTTEISGYLLAFGISWALAETFVTRSHVRIDVLLNMMPVKLRAVLHLMALAILAVFVGFVAYGSLQLVLESWDFGATDISMLKVPLVIPQGLWSLGIWVFLALIVLLLAETVLLLLAGQYGAVDALYAPRTYVEEAQETLDALGIREGAQ